MKQVTIIGMSCEHCVSAVTNALKDLGLKNVTVDLVSGIATFDATHAVTPKQLEQAIGETGFDISATA